MPEDWFSSIKVQEGNFLRRKELFEYTTSMNVYDIELFQNQDGTFYAIGVPKEGRIVVYGSAIVNDRGLALQTVVDKIRRDGMEEKDNHRQINNQTDG